MSKNHIFLGIGIIAFLAISFQILQIDFSKIERKSNSVSAPEFSKERQYWEWERLRDPNTGLVPKNIRSLENNFVNNMFGSYKFLKSKDDFLQSNKWQRRGPWEVGGRTRALGIDIRNEDIILAGGISGGMWRSTDNGQSWVKTTLPHQLHSISCLVQDTRDGKQDIWYAGTGELYGNSADITGDGIYKSTDNGLSWELLPSTTTNKPQTFDNNFDYVVNIIVNTSAPIETDEIYVATGYNGIFRSVDAGLTWTKVLGGAKYANLWSDIAITSTGIFYATLSSQENADQYATQGIYRSENGFNWTKIHNENFPKKYNRIVIGIAPSDENKVYFISETPGSGLLTTNSRGDSLYHSFWKYTYLDGDGSGNNGIWEDRSHNLPNTEEVKGRMNSQWGYDLVLRVKPDDPNVVFIGAVAMYRSNDAFKTNNFTIIGGICPFDECDYQWRYPNHHADLHQIIFSRNNPNVLYTGSDGGVHKSIDCMADVQNWISLNNGYFTTQFYALGIDHKDTKNEMVIGGLQDNGTLLSLKNEMMREWNNPTRGDGFFCQIPNDGAYVISSQNSTPQPKISIWRTILNEDGTNLIQTRIDPIGGKDFIWNTPFILDPNETNRMYLAGGKMVWRNNDLMQIPLINSKDSTSINWDSLNHTRIDFIVGDTRSEHISAIQVSTKPANVLYYGTTRGRLYRIDNAHIGNPQPIEITGKYFPKAAYIGSISIDPDDASNVTISFTNYGIMSIFNSKDAGANWTAISGNLEERPDGTGIGPGVKWIEILKIKDKKLYYAGTTAGLFSTAFINGESTVWKQEGATTIGNVPVDMIDARHEDGYVVVGTHGAGIFQAHVSELPTLPEKTSLVSPLNLTKNLKEKTNLVWNAEQTAGVYEVQISTNPNFATIDTIIGGLKGTSIEVSGLKQGFVNYFWRVRTVNDAGFSDFSEVWSFTTAIAAPDLVFPTNGLNNVSINPILVWQNVEKAEKYRLQVSSGVGYNLIILDTIIQDTSYQLLNLQSNRRHNFRVTSFFDDIESIYSLSNYFITENTGSISKGKSNNLFINCYPNPIRYKGNINFNVNDGNVMIELIDATTGRIVSRLLNEFKNEGFYNLEFNTEKYSTGAYLIRIINNGNTSIKSVKIVK